MAQCAQRNRDLETKAFARSAFVASESASAAGSFSNWTGLAPLSTMIGAICRSLSQREKTEQKKENLSEKINRIERYQKM